MFPRLILLAALWLVLAGPAAAAAEFRSGGEVRHTQPTEGELIAAGRSVSIDAPVGGDAIAAGLDLRLIGPVAGDAILAAFDLAIKGAVGGDLIATAMDMEITGNVAGDVLVSGVDVALRRGASVAGDLVASGADLTLEGMVNGDAQLSGDRVTIAGTVLGDVDVTANSLDLRPGARIMGELRHTGPQPVEVPDGVTLGGTLRHHYKTAVADGPTVLGTAGKALALFVLGFGVLWLMPATVLRSAALMRRRPLRPLLLGVAILLLVPALLALLMVSVIGIPVGLLLLGLYILGLPVGVAVTGFGLADLIHREARRPGPDIAGLLRRYALVVVGLVLLALVPYAGWIGMTLTAAAGLGALADATLAGRRDRRVMG